LNGCGENAVMLLADNRAEFVGYQILFALGKDYAVGN
jgi:hypothetical protein